MPDVPLPPRRDRGRADDGAVPPARPGTAGPAPGTADRRGSSYPGGPTDRPAPAGGDGNGVAAPTRGENGARLADLLAEAMDAFRHGGPGEGTRGADVGARPV